MPNARSRSASRSRSSEKISHRSFDKKRRDYTPERQKSSRSGYTKDVIRYRSHSRMRSRTRSRSPLRTRSRSPAPKRYGNKSSYSRSRSRTRDRSRSNYEQPNSYSRSPLSQRRRHEQPQRSRCLGVFGLNVFTTEYKIREIFSKYGPIQRVQVVIDAKTGKSRGFCFVYFGNVDDGKVAKEQCSGMEIDDRRVRVDYSITLRAHTPTPGVYMGKPTRMYREKEYHDRYRENDNHNVNFRHRDRRSPSPHRERRRRYDRSRSRSFSPRRRFR